MKYVCRICGYVYDDAKQKTPFADLPDSWVCPLCGAPKSDFGPQGEAKKEAKAAKPVNIDPDMKQLSPAQLSALCTNLARGCEKQYRQKEASLFTELGEYFASIAPEAESPELSDIAKMLETDIDEGYGNIRAAAEGAKDRGALRVCVWGEKVSKILDSLIKRYEKEGEAFLENTQIWVCTVCGFVYVGETAPALCPVCKVPDWKFEKIEGRHSA